MDTEKLITELRSFILGKELIGDPRFREVHDFIINASADAVEIYFKEWNDNIIFSYTMSLEKYKEVAEQMGEMMIATVAMAKYLEQKN